MPVKKRKSQKNGCSNKLQLKKKKTPNQTGGKRVSSKKTTLKKKQKGGKLNAFFKLMLAAKKKDLSEFKYNGNTYKQFTAKTGLKMYKKA